MNMTTSRYIFEDLKHLCATDGNNYNNIVYVDRVLSDLFDVPRLGSIILTMKDPISFIDEVIKVNKFVERFFNRHLANGRRKMVKLLAEAIYLEKSTHKTDTKTAIAIRYAYYKSIRRLKKYFSKSSKQVKVKIDIDDEIKQFIDIASFEKDITPSLDELMDRVYFYINYLGRRLTDDEMEEVINTGRLIIEEDYDLMRDIACDGIDDLEDSDFIQLQNEILAKRVEELQKAVKESTEEEEEEDDDDDEDDRLPTEEEIVKGTFDMNAYIQDFLNTTKDVLDSGGNFESLIDALSAKATEDEIVAEMDEESEEEPEEKTPNLTVDPEAKIGSLNNSSTPADEFNEDQMKKS